MNKKNLIILIVIGIIVLGLIVGYLIFSKNIFSKNKKLKICPDQWYDNKMPTTVGNKNSNSQYFVLDGKRRELSEFNLNWIKNNCDVNKPSPVY